MQTITAIINTLRMRRWYINAFVLAGALLALRFSEVTGDVAFRIVFAVAVTCILSSANYALNEVLDAKSDSHHPEKKERPIPSGRISRNAILLLACGLYVIVLALVFATGDRGLIVSCGALLLSGLLYNIPPIRLKDIPFLDFISEGINNPIRLMIGWYAVTTAIFPSSLFIALWTFAIFLMAAKRFAEFRFLDNPIEAVQYRKSFRFYTEQKLLLAMIGAISACMYMLGVLTIRYEKNLVLSLPFLIVFIIWLCAIAYQKHSFIKDPEHLLSNKYFLMYLALLVAIIAGLLVYPQEIFHF